MSLLTKVWIIVFLPLWFLKFGPCPAKFLCHSFHYDIKLIYSDWSFFEPRFAGTRFYIVYCQVKWCILGFHFRRSLFCVDFVGLYWTFLIVFGTAMIFGAKWLLHSEDHFLKEFWFLFHWIQNNSCPVEVWQSFTSSQHISLCSLQPRSPKWIALLNHTVFKSASAVELPKLWLKPFPSLLELDVFRKAKSIVFFLQMMLKASEECH